MRLYWEVVRRSFARHLTYRAAAVAGLLTNFFFGLLRLSVLLALYGQRQAVEGYSVADIIGYTVLTQAVLTYLSLFGWYELMEAVYTGEVATHLTKPLGLLQFWLAQDLGRALVGLLLRGVLLVLLFELFFDLAYPETAVQRLGLAAAVALSWLLSFAWRFLINLPAFWSPNARGIIRFGFVISWFFSGFLMPLRFLPVWVQQVAAWTPFPHLVNTVFDVYAGVLQGPALLGALAWQAAWSAALLLAGQLVLKTAVRRLVILGG